MTIAIPIPAIAILRMDDFDDECLGFAGKSWSIAELEI
jgi:hypothetical protein